MPAPKLSAIILAAGKGSRFGTPKAVALLDGITFLELIHNKLKEAGINTIISVVNTDTMDMFASLQRGVNDPAAKGSDGYLVYPVDHPLVSVDTLKLLKKSFEQDPNSIIKPAFEGKKGHPIIIPASLNLYPEIAFEGLAELIRKSDIPVRILSVNDSGILQNVNYPDDLKPSHR